MRGEGPRDCPVVPHAQSVVAAVVVLRSKTAPQQVSMGLDKMIERSSAAVVVAPGKMSRAIKAKRQQNNTQKEELAGQYLWAGVGPMLLPWLWFLLCWRVVHNVVSAYDTRIKFYE